MSTPRQAEQRRLLIWWFTSASILLVVVAAVAVYWIFTTVSSFVASHPIGCLPSGFPKYPNVVVQEVDQSFRVSASPAQCRVRMASRDDFESVDAFYHVQLNVNDWMLTGYANDGNESTIAFGQRSRRATSGVMSIYQVPGLTDVQVQLSG